MNGDGSGSTVVVVFIGAVAALVACVIVFADPLPTQILVIVCAGCAAGGVALLASAIRHPRPAPDTRHANPPGDR